MSICKDALFDKIEIIASKNWADYLQIVESTPDI